MAFSNIARLDAAANIARVLPSEIELRVLEIEARRQAWYAVGDVQHHPSGIYETLEAEWHVAGERLLAATPTTPLEFCRKFEGIFREKDSPSDLIMENLLADARRLIAA